MSALTDPVEPMLATAGALPDSSEGWVFEPKWDGVRALVRVNGGKVRAYSRTGKDLTVAFPELTSSFTDLGSDVLIDGEIVAFDGDGVPSFEVLQRRLNLANPTVIAQRADEVPASYVAFDLLVDEGRSLLDRGYDERRSRLEDRIDLLPGVVLTPAYRDADGRAIFAAMRDAGMEGIVAKRADSLYRPGRRNKDWIKVKAIRTQEVVIGGWTAGKGSLADSLGALLLGVPDQGGLRYAGKVGTGFDTRARRSLLQQLQPLAIDHCPFAVEPERSERVGATYVEPVVVGEVMFTGWTGDGRLRQPSWRGLRTDKNAADVVVE